MSNNNQLTPQQQKGCAIGCLSVIALIVIALIIGAMTDAINKNAKEDAAEKSMDTSLSMEERLEYAVIGALGEENNMGDLRNVTVSVPAENAYTISFLADESSSQVTTLEMDIIDVLEGIKPIDGIQAVVIQAKTGFLDEYGNEVVDNGLNISMVKSEIDKINFENFYSAQLKNVAFYNLHPALSK